MHVVVCQPGHAPQCGRALKWCKLREKSQEVFYLQLSPPPCFPTACPLHFPAEGTNTYCPWKLFLSNPGHLGNEALNKYWSVCVCRECTHMYTHTHTQPRCCCKVKYRPCGRGTMAGVGLHGCRASELLFVVGWSGIGNARGVGWGRTFVLT